MQNTTVIYGVHSIKARLKIHSDAIQVIYCIKGKEGAPRLGELRSLAHSKSAKFELLSKERFNQLLTENQLDDVVHQNVLAVCESQVNLYQENDLPQLISSLEKPAFILVLDNVQDPHNLGACIRSADAAGVDFVVFPKDKSATINATVEKVASGALTTMKIVSVTNLVRAIGVLKDSGIWITGLAGEAQKEIYDHDFTDSIAIVMGSEGTGLRFGTRKTCDYLAKLPMYGHVSSLNVSVAAGVALYEVVRQRR